MYYAGPHIHKKYCISAVMDREGKMIDRAGVIPWIEHKDQNISLGKPGSFTQKIRTAYHTLRSRIRTKSRAFP